MADLVVNENVSIPADELQWRFSTSGGPGGQHANKSETRAEVSFDVAGSRVLSDSQKEHITAELASRVRGGLVTVSADDTRSQSRNRDLARERLANLLADALREERPRIGTKPSRSSRRKRVDDKKARGRKKALRRKPDMD